MKVKLGEVCTIVSGTTPKTGNPAYWDGSINWVTPAELTDDTDVVQETARKITELAVKDSHLTLCPAGTVLLSSRAPIGKVAIAGVPMYCNQGFKNLICSDRVWNKYLFWFLKCKNAHLNSLGRGTTFKEISKPIVENVELPLPELPEQHRIAAVLDTVSAQIAAHKRQLARLDEMVKARFVEMFGDHKLNPKGFKTIQGRDLFVFSSGKFLEDSKRQKTGIPVYGGNGIAWYTNDPLIDYNTLVIGRVGAYCGNIKQINEPAWITDNAIYIKKFKTNDLHLIFLYFLMEFANFATFANASGQPKITQKPLEEHKYMVPPLALQQEFAAFVQQRDKVKTAVHSALAQLETLKAALMQEYFA